MESLRLELEHAADAFYAGEEENGVKIFMNQVGQIGSISGVVEWVNPLFDALERRDYLYAADILRYRIVPLIA
jgi:hypothetical protein